MASRRVLKTAEEAVDPLKGKYTMSIVV